MYRAPDDPERVLTTQVVRWLGSVEQQREDALAVEEPLELFSGPRPLAVIMRTPGHDDELAAGFLHGEGLITARDQLDSLQVWRDDRGDFAQNRVTILFKDGIAPEIAMRRFYATSSCGICGKESIDAALQLAPPLVQRLALNPQTLYALPEKLRAAQNVFDRTGGLHAAALFDFEGRLETLREDVGRHNAVDKLIGRALLDGRLPLEDRLLLVSGRVSFEILQKSLAARIPAVAAISAPSSLAVSLARRCNIALFGFLRADRVNVYA